MMYPSWLGQSVEHETLFFGAWVPASRLAYSFSLYYGKLGLLTIMNYSYNRLALFDNIIEILFKT